MTAIEYRSVAVTSGFNKAVSTLSRCFIEARPAVQVIFSLRFLCGAVLVGVPGVAALGRIAGAAVAWELAVASVYLFNGVMDVAEDRVNGSRRPIARGDLHPATALRIAVGMAVLAVASSFLLGIRFGCLVLAVLALGYLYSGPPFQMKRRTWTTSLTVVPAALLTYYAGSVSGGGAAVGHTLAAFAVVLSLWMGLVGANTKDFSDVAGDAAAGRRTGLVVHGETRIRLIAAALALGVGALHLLAAAVVAPALLWPAVATQAGAVAVAALALSRLSTGRRSRRRRPYRAFMITQYVVHLGLLASVAA